MLALLVALSILQDESIDDTVRLHLIAQPELTFVREMVEARKGTDFEYHSSDHSVTFRFKGKLCDLDAMCSKINEVGTKIAEKDSKDKKIPAKDKRAAFGVALVSHCRMRFTLVASAGSGATPARLERELADYKAIKKVVHVSRTSLEALVDATQLWPPDVAKLCESPGYTATSTTHELIEVKLVGDKWEATTREFNALRGILMVRVDPMGQTVRMLGTKGDVQDKALKAAAEKAGMTLDVVRRN